MSWRYTGLRSGIRRFLVLLEYHITFLCSYFLYLIKVALRRDLEHQDELPPILSIELRPLFQVMRRKSKLLALYQHTVQEKEAELKALHTKHTALLRDLEKRGVLINPMDGNSSADKVPSAAAKHTIEKLPAELGKGDSQILKPLDESSSTKDVLSQLRVLGESSNTPTLGEDSLEARTSVTWRETLKGLQEKMKSLKRSLEAREETIRLLQDEMETLSHSLAQTSKLAAQHQRMSSQIKDLKRKQTSLTKLMEKKTIFLKVKTRQLRLLKENLRKKEDENTILAQSVKNRKDQMSTLEMKLQNAKEENERLLVTTKQNFMAFEDSNAKLRVSIHEKEQDFSAMKEELHAREKLLKEKDQKARQLIHDIMSTLQKFLAKRQETDRNLSQKKHSEEQVLPSKVTHLQEELSQVLGKFHHNIPQSPDSDIPESLKEKNGQAGVDAGAGAECRPGRALSSTTTTSDLGIMTSWEELQLPEPVPTTITTTKSSTANTQQLGAKPKPSTTGTGLTELERASGDLKSLATQVLGTVKCFNIKNRYGFIIRNDTQENIFVPETAVKKNNPWKYLPSLRHGETVEFDVVEGEKGVEAANVTGPRGAAVQGSKYVAERTRSWRYPGRRAPGPHYPHGYLATDGDGSDGTSTGQARPRWHRGRQQRLPRYYQPPPQDSITPVQGDVQGAQGVAKDDHGQLMGGKVYQGCRPSCRPLCRPRHHNQSGQDYNEADSEDQRDKRPAEASPALPTEAPKKLHQRINPQKAVDDPQS